VYRKDREKIAINPLFTGTKVFNGTTLVVVHGLDEAVPIETTNAFIKSFKAESYQADGFKHSFSDPLNPQDETANYIKTLVNWLS